MANTIIIDRIKSSGSFASVDAKWGPYASVAAAHAKLGENGDDVAVVGLTVGIVTGNTVTEYWYQGGTTQAHLVPKQATPKAGEILDENYGENGASQSDINELHRQYISDHENTLSQHDEKIVDLEEEMEEKAEKFDVYNASAGDVIPDGALLTWAGAPVETRIAEVNETKTLMVACARVKENNADWPNPKQVRPFTSFLFHSLVQTSTIQPGAKPFDGFQEEAVVVEQQGLADTPSAIFFNNEMGCFIAQASTLSAVKYYRTWNNDEDYTTNAASNKFAKTAEIDGQSVTAYFRYTTEEKYEAGSITNFSQLSADLKEVWGGGQLSGKEDTSNKVTSFSDTPSDEHYPSEKLVYDTAVAPLNATLTKVPGTKNLYDYSTVGKNTGMVTTNGTITNQFNSWHTGLIPVLPNHYYYLSSRKYGSNQDIRSVRCLESDKTTVHKVLAPSNGAEYSTYSMPNADGSGALSAGQFKTPANVAYLQANLAPANRTEWDDDYKIMLEDVGDTYNPNFVPSVYEDYGTPKTVVKNECIDMDSVPTSGSKKPVSSGGVYEALQAVEPKEKKELKVLLVGSSHGVNSICMFPVLAYHAGVEITVGNLYSGSANLKLNAERPNVQIPYMAKNDVAFSRFAVFEDGKYSLETHKTLSYALSHWKWDVIILQRAALENQVWNDEMSGFYKYLLDYVAEHTVGYSPKIYFNSGLADPRSNKTNQVSYTNAIMSSAIQQKEEYGIDVIPMAVAVQYARMTYLTNLGSGRFPDLCYDTQHLDLGIGQYLTGCALFEKILGDVFGMSVRELEYYPTFSDIRLNALVDDENDFTPITDYYAEIAKNCAMMAVQDVVYDADHAAVLAAAYGSLPTQYTVTNNLTGCSNNNDAVTMNSGDAYLALLTVDSGLTMQSVTVTMGGVDITEDVYVDSYTLSGTTYVYHAIRIGRVTGNIVITATATGNNS